MNARIPPAAALEAERLALLAVADFRRCLRQRDYAGAVRLIRERPVLDGLDMLARNAARARADADRALAEAAAARLGDADRARVQAAIGPLLDEVIGVLAKALGGPKGPVCTGCRRVLPTRRRNCPHCGTQDARPAVAA